MSYPAANLVQDVRAILGEDVSWQTLATAGNAADTTIDVTDGTDWNEGDIIEWVSDGDQAYVQSVSGNVLTVIRSVNGTTGAAHAGTAAIKNPGYPYIKVTQAIEMVMMTLWPWAWKVEEAASILPDTSTRYYDLANNVIDLVRVWQEDSAIPLGVRSYGTKGSGRNVSLHQDFNSVLGITTNYAISFPNGFFHATNPIYVQYRRKIDNTQSLGSYVDISDGNLTECIRWGAAARLLRMQPAARLRNDARQYQQVDITDVAATADFYYSEHRRLLMDVHDELLRTSAPMGNYVR